MGSHKANHGQNYRRMCSEDGIEGPCSDCAAACCFCLCPECLPCAHANTAKQVGMGNCFLNYLCCECCPFFWGCQVLRVRQKIREELKLPQQSCFADCLKAWFCLGCIIWKIAKQSRQIKSICHQKENSTSPTPLLERSLISQNKFYETSEISFDIRSADEETKFILS